MLILLQACSSLFGEPPPATLPPGWSCDRSKVDAWTCIRDVDGVELSLIRTHAKISERKGDASSQCVSTAGVPCLLVRQLIGDYALSSLELETPDTYLYAMVDGPRAEDPAPTWRLADEILPQVRFHAVEALCQERTGKPCETTFGPMELQPQGDPRALAR